MLPPAECFTFLDIDLSEELPQYRDRIEEYIGEIMRHLAFNRTQRVEKEWKRLKNYLIDVVQELIDKYNELYDN